MFDLVGDPMEACFKTHMCRGWLALSSSSGKHARSTLPSLPCSERGHETEFWPVEHGRKCYVPLSALTRETTLSSCISAWVLISKVTLEAWWWRWWRCNHSGSLSHTLEQRAPLPTHCHCSGLPVLTLQRKRVLLSEVIETLGFANLDS